MITPQPAYLDEVKKWVDRLDKAGGDGGGLQFYVYNLSEPARGKLGPLLQQAFTGRAVADRDALGADGRARHAHRYDRQSADVPAGESDHGHATRPSAHRRRPPTPASAASATGSGIVRNLQVVADKDNNTLLIIATAAEYSVIEAALRKLDVPQRQVVMEVTIAEVTLTDDVHIRRRLAVQGRRAVGPRLRRQHQRTISSALVANPGHAARRRTTNPAGRARAEASPTSSTTRTFPAASRRR